jgi:hypothetical protein
MEVTTIAAAWKGSLMLKVVFKRASSERGSRTSYNKDTWFVETIVMMYVAVIKRAVCI